MLKGKTVILGITGSIAAYKMANVASMLKKLHCNVEVIMTKNAVNFINPITFETLTGNKCLIDTFDRNFQFQVEHISLAKRADLLMVAPASANIIGKLANGIADDMLTTTALACTCQKIIAPAMNTNMYLNPIVQDNMKRLQNYGFEMVEAASGHLACGDSGIGKLPEEKLLVEHIVRSIAREKDESSGQCRSYDGSNRSGSLYHKSFNRKNGICPGESCDAAWSFRDGCKRAHRGRGAAFCKDGSGKKCTTDV